MHNAPPDRPCSEVALHSCAFLANFPRVLVPTRQPALGKTLTYGGLQSPYWAIMVGYGDLISRRITSYTDKADGSSLAHLWHGGIIEGTLQQFAAS